MVLPDHNDKQIRSRVDLVGSNSRGDLVRGLARSHTSTRRDEIRGSLQHGWQERARQHDVAAEACNTDIWRAAENAEYSLSIIFLKL